MKLMFKNLQDDNYHFVTYVPIDGHIYELDGLRPAPIDLGVVKEGQDWLDVVRPIIDKRIQKFVIQFLYVFTNNDFDECGCRETFNSSAASFVGIFSVR